MPQLLNAVKTVFKEEIMGLDEKTGNIKNEMDNIKFRSECYKQTKGFFKFLKH